MHFAKLMMPTLYVEYIGFLSINIVDSEWENSYLARKPAVFWKRQPKPNSLCATFRGFIRYIRPAQLKARRANLTNIHFATGSKINFTVQKKFWKWRLIISEVGLLQHCLQLQKLVGRMLCRSNIHTHQVKEKNMMKWTCILHISRWK